MAQLITYKIETDLDGRLKAGARTACSFWNSFLVPKETIVLRLGVFSDDDTTIAYANKPYARKGVRYGVVRFNSSYLAGYSAAEISGTLVHEIGHTLGIGWEAWDKLFNPNTGKFKPAAIKRLPALAQMLVQTDDEPGTTLVHWDEATFGAELMTGYTDAKEHVLPVTIEVMALFGHTLRRRLAKKTPLKTLLDKAGKAGFAPARKALAKSFDLDYYESTPISERLFPCGGPRRPRA